MVPIQELLVTDDTEQLLERLDLREYGMAGMSVKK